MLLLAPITWKNGEITANSLTFSTSTRKTQWSIGSV